MVNGFSGAVRMVGLCLRESNDYEIYKRLSDEKINKSLTTVGEYQIIGI